MLIVLVSMISNLQVFLLKKNVSSFCKCNFFSTKIFAYMPYSMISFNHMLTNDIVSFEQLGPDLYIFWGSNTAKPCLSPFIVDPFSKTEQTLVYSLF